MSSLLKILLPFFVVSCFSLNIAIANNSELKSYEVMERSTTKFMESLEKQIDLLQKDIKYWEHQLTGPRRYFYPDGFVRNTIKKWIEDYKIDLSKKNKDMIIYKEERERLLKKIVELETEKESGEGPLKPEDPTGTYQTGGYLVKISDANESSITYEGTDGRTFYHKGELTWDSEEKGYKGTLQDLANGSIKDQQREAIDAVVYFSLKNSKKILSFNALTWSPKAGKKVSTLQGQSGTLKKGGEWPFK